MIKTLDFDLNFLPKIEKYMHKSDSLGTIKQLSGLWWFAAM